MEKTDVKKMPMFFQGEDVGARIFKSKFREAPRIRKYYTTNNPNNLMIISTRRHGARKQINTTAIVTSTDTLNVVYLVNYFDYLFLYVLKILSEYGEMPKIFLTVVPT